MKITLRNLIPAWLEQQGEIRYLEHRFDLEGFFERVKALHGEGIILKACATLKLPSFLYWGETLEKSHKGE